MMNNIIPIFCKVCWCNSQPDTKYEWKYFIEMFDNSKRNVSSF